MNRPIAHRHLPRLCIVTTLLLWLSLGPTHLLAAQRFIALGTASKQGVYHPVGKEICTLINLDRLEHGLRCTTFETGGSVYNLYAIASGDMDVAITRIDLAYDALHVQDSFASLPEGSELRSITTLYKMPVGILVKKNSGITNFEDFPGKRINIGNLGSGRRDIAVKLFEVMNWTKEDFSGVYEYRTTDMQEAFCDGSVDILIGAFAVPAKFYDELTTNCEAKFLPIPEAVIARTILKDPSFERGVIPGGVYPANPTDVPTVQVNTVLVTSTRAKNSAIRQLVASLFENLEHFRASHSALADFSLDNIHQAKRTIPLHPGVLEYLKQGADLQSPNPPR